MKKKFIDPNILRKSKTVENQFITNELINITGGEYLRF